MARSLPHHHVQHAGSELFRVVRGSTETHVHLRNRVFAIVWVTVALDLLSTAIVFLTERHAAGTQIHTVFQALLFSTSQLLTASSVDSPSTDWIKVLELFFDIYAIMVVATLAGSFGQFFHRRSEEHRAAAAGGAPLHPAATPPATESA